MARNNWAIVGSGAPRPNPAHWVWLGGAGAKTAVFCLLGGTTRRISALFGYPSLKPNLKSLLGGRWGAWLEMPLGSVNEEKVHLSDEEKNDKKKKKKKSKEGSDVVDQEGAPDDAVAEGEKSDNKKEKKKKKNRDTEEAQ